MKRLFKVDSSYHSYGHVLFAWQPHGNCVATVGANCLLHVLDRHGDQIEEIPLDSSEQVIALEWDKDGDTLAILQQGNSNVLLWEPGGRGLSSLQTEMRDPTFLSWSSTGPQLAVGTRKGNLLLYNKVTKKKIPILGKHAKNVGCGLWLADSRLVLGSDDKSISVSTPQGDTVQQTTLRHSPLQISVQPSGAMSARSSGPRGAETICVNVGGKFLALYDTSADELSCQRTLDFGPDHGSIVAHYWYSNDQLLVTFANGRVCLVSLVGADDHKVEKSAKLHHSRQQRTCFSSGLQRLCSYGDKGLKMLDVPSWKEEDKAGLDLDDAEEYQVYQMSFTEDGQILGLSSANGIFQTILARVPALVASNASKIAYLTSLRELTVVDIADSTTGPSSSSAAGSAPVSVTHKCQISLSIEPSFIFLGPGHAAVGMNNRVWFYAIKNGKSKLVNEEELVGVVSSLRLNSTCVAMLVNGKISLQQIDGRSRNGAASGPSMKKTFPPADSTATTITCMEMTEDFLIYGTSLGTVEFVSLASGTLVSQCSYRHSASIKLVSVNPHGSRVLVVDSNSQAVLFNPAGASHIPVTSFPFGCSAVLWDQRQSEVFYALGPNECFSLIYCPYTLRGPVVRPVTKKKGKRGGKQIKNNNSSSGRLTGSSRSAATDVDEDLEESRSDLPAGMKPILVMDGRVHCQLADGQLGNFVTKTHSHLELESSHARQGVVRSFRQRLALVRLADAWDLALDMDEPEALRILGKTAMQYLDVEVATWAYRQLGDVGMVMALQQLRSVEEEPTLAGSLAVLLEDYDLAQELFLSSSKPLHALVMRCDLLQWGEALEIARTLAPTRVEDISVKFARQLEARGEYQRALEVLQAIAGEEGRLNDRDVEGGEKYFNRGSATGDKGLSLRVSGGIARCNLHLGEVRRGLRLVRQAGDPKLTMECASILENLRQYQEAATLFESCGQWDRAMALYLENKQLARAAQLVSHVRSSPLLCRYATLREVSGDADEALKAFELAKDTDNFVRLCLSKKKDLSRAIQACQRGGSSQSARLVAEHCEKNGDVKMAIRFYVQAGRVSEAFKLAKTSEMMEAFCGFMGDHMSPTECNQVAQYYEEHKNWQKAANYYASSGEFAKSLKLYLLCGEDALDKAIEVVGKAKSDVLTHTLIDFLVGENDGIPKNPRHIFHLYMALGNYLQAAKTAIVIAQQEQSMGNYEASKEILLKTLTELRKSKIRAPQVLSRILLLLHSYTLIKRLIKLGQHETAARMLLRVAQNLSKFPKHVVPILTSTVIECHRVGLNRHAFEYATILMQPQHRQEINSKFKRKIESIVRKPRRDEDDEENRSPCPHCEFLLPDTELDCSSCKTTIDYCILTGRHMLRNDWSECSSCKFPLLYSAATKILSDDSDCPMCHEPLSLKNLERIEPTFANSEGAQQHEQQSVVDAP